LEKKRKRILESTCRIHLEGGELHVLLKRGGGHGDPTMLENIAEGGEDISG